MGRKPNAPKAARRARDHHQLRGAYLGLDEAAVFLRDQGDVEAIGRALDQLEAGAVPRPIEGMADQATRSDKAKYLADRYVAASHIVTRCRLLLDDLTASKEAFRDQLIATLAVPDDVKDYQRIFIDRLSAAGIGQRDLHTGGRKMADEVAVFIRQYHAARRGGGTQGTPDNHADELPVSSWSELPHKFAGVEMVDVEDPTNFDVCPLPPSTDIANYTDDGIRPSLGATRSETVETWARIIKSWCNNNDTVLPPVYRSVWALLLSHNMPADTSDLANLERVEIASPWSNEGIVRLKDLTGVVPRGK